MRGIASPARAVIGIALLVLPDAAGPPAATGTTAEVERARVLLEEGELDQAAALLSVTVRQPSSRGESLVLLCRLAGARGDHEQAVEYGKQAVEALPTSGEAHYRLAVALREQMVRTSRLKAVGVLGEYKAALARSVALDPGHLDARAEEIGFLISAPAIAGGDREKARRRIDELMRLDPRRGTTMTAVLRRAEEDREGAIAVLAGHLRRDGEDHDNRLFLAILLQDSKRYQEADAELEPLLAAPDLRVVLRATYQMARGRVLGSYDQHRAVALLTDYLQRRPENARGLPSRAVALWRLGQAHQQLGEITKAREVLQQALVLEPDNDEIKKGLKALPKG